MPQKNAQSKSKITVAQPYSAERRIVNLIFIIYWLLIFEGVLRKWMFPGLNKLLFFVRDPFVLFVYYLAFRYRLWPSSNLFFKIGLVLMGVFIPLIVFQCISLENDALVSIYGWRNYFFYLPLAFIIGRIFEGKDLYRLVKHTLLVTIPIALLVMVQYRSPASAWVNRSYDPQAAIYVIAEGVVRPTGTFTFNQGQVIFVCSAIAMMFAVWMLPRNQNPLNRVLLLICSLAVLACTAFCGSRGVFFALAFSGIAACMAGALLAKDSARRLELMALPLVLLTLGTVLYVTVFHEAFSLMRERQALAVAGEGSTIGRAMHSVFSVTEVIPDLTPLGKGVGLGSNAGAFLMAGKRQFLLYEDEWPRVVQEAGPLGFIYMFYRVALSIWLVSNAIPAIRRSGNPLPALLLSFLVPLLVAGPMTLQGTANGYGWLFAGLCMAANNLRLPANQRS